ncbi:MAG: RNA polymerase sigma factor [Clostridiales bacterium]|nr:RNA polymerase sigma factor [Clostridiales bacterium]
MRALIVSEVRKVENRSFETIVNEARGGSKEAFCTIYGMYKDKLYRYALYRLGDPQEAEDAVSDCVLAAWQGLGSLRSSAAFSSWIFSILRNCCASRIREAVRLRESTEQMYGNDAVHTTDPSLATELTEALGILAEEEREVVLLSVIGGLSSKEISGLTGLTPGSVRSRLSRSLSKMREFLG